MTHPKYTLTSTTPRLTGAKLAITALALALGTFMQVLDSTIANVSLPTICGDLGVSSESGTWVITAFAATNAVLVPLTGWLMMRFGIVRVFTAALLAFTVASFLCGIAWNLPVLVAFRVLQGAVSGPLIPGSQALLISVFPPHRRATALTIWSMTTMSAPVFGPVLGGYISDNFYWGWIFFINLPIGLVAAVISWRALKTRETPTRKLPIDMWGLVLLTIWVFSLQTMLDLGKDLDWFHSTTIVVLAICAVVGFAIWVVWELTDARPVVDTTVQEKAIAHPVDSRLLEIARHKVVAAAKRAGIALKQTFVKEGKSLRRRAGGYAHAKQFKRLRKVVKRQRTILGIVLREVGRKIEQASEATALTLTSLRTLMQRAERIRSQRPKDKNKLYALHAPEVECIGKGKARKPYEFGVKVSVAVTHKQGLMVGARSFSGNPYDGHTLNEQLEQATILTEDTGAKPKQVVVDLGFRGVDAANPGVQIIHRGKFKSLTDQQRKWLKRRQAVEPAIGHLKHDNAMDRCWLQGATGDALHAVLCAAGYNIRWLLRAIVRLGLKGLFAPLFALLVTLTTALAMAIGVRKTGLGRLGWSVE